MQHIITLIKFVFFKKIKIIIITKRFSKMFHINNIKILYHNRIEGSF